ERGGGDVNGLGDAADAEIEIDGRRSTERHDGLLHGRLKRGALCRDLVAAERHLGERVASRVVGAGCPRVVRILVARGHVDADDGPAGLVEHLTNNLAGRRSGLSGGMRWGKHAEQREHGHRAYKNTGRIHWQILRPKMLSTSESEAAAYRRTCA